MASYLQSKKFKTDILGLRVLAQADFNLIGSTGYEVASEGMMVAVDSDTDPAETRRSTARRIMVYSQGNWSELAIVVDGVLTITAPEGEGAGLVLASDGPLAADDAGDSWKIHGNDAGTGKLTFANDQASKGSFVEMASITANATPANSTADFAGHVTVGHDLHLEADSSIFKMGAGSDVTLTHDGSTGATLASAGNFIIDGADTVTIDSDSTLTVGARSINIDADGGDDFGSVAIDTTDTTNGIKIGTATSGVPITLGHTTSEVTVADNLVVTGDLTVSGDTTTVNTTNLNVEDALVVLQHQLTAGNTTDMGIIMERGSTGDNAAIIWDEGDDKFLLGTTTETGGDNDVTVAVGTVQVGKLEIDGKTNHLDVASNMLTATAAVDFIVDADRNIVLDANGGQINFTDDGATMMVLTNNGLSFDDGTIIGAITNDSRTTQLIMRASNADAGYHSNIELDADGNIELNAAAGTIDFKADTASMMQLTNTGLAFDDATTIEVSSGDLDIKTTGADADIKFTVKDGSTVRQAFTLDGSESASAVFNPLAGGFLSVSTDGITGVAKIFGDGNVELATVSDTPATACKLEFFKRRAASPFSVQADDVLGQIEFNGLDTITGSPGMSGPAARITGIADADFGASSTDAPGRLVFSTSPDGSETPVDRMVIKSDGKVGINQSSPSHTLDVVGDVNIGTNSYMVLSDNQIGVTSGNLTLDVAGDVNIDAAGGDFKVLQTGQELLGVSAAGLTLKGPTEIDVASGDLTLDVAGEIELNADGGKIRFKDSSATLAELSAGELSFPGAATIEVDANTATDHQDLIIKATNAHGTATSDIELDAEGEIRINSDAGTILFQDDSASLMTLTNDGLSFDDATEIDVSSGNLTLDVEGNIELNANGGTIDFKDDTTSLAQLSGTGLNINTGNVQLTNGYQIQWGDSETAIFGNSTSDYIRLKTAGLDRVSVDSAGKVGIGEINPDTMLHVVGNSGLTIEESGATTRKLVIEPPTASTISTIRTEETGGGLMLKSFNAGNQLFLKDDGKIGIGVTDPDSTLEILSTGTQLKLSNNLDDYATFAVGTNGNLAITTVDAAYSGAHMTLSADGDIRMDGATGIKIGNASDKLVDIDAAVFSVVASDNSEIAVNGSGKTLEMTSDGAMSIGSSTQMNINTAASGVPISIGHTTSETTVNDNLTVVGNLTVNGTTTTVNSTTISVDDKNIELGSVDTPSDTTADGGGITLKGASDKEFKWVNATGRWTTNVGLHVNTNDSLVLPVGNNGNRGTATRGGIRYNTDISAFEGYNGSSWNKLTGLQDTDGDTRITAETNPGVDEDKLKFYTTGRQRLEIDVAGKLHHLRTDGNNNVNFFGPTKVWDKSDSILDFVDSLNPSGAWTTQPKWTAQGAPAKLIFNNAVVGGSRLVYTESYTGPLEPRVSTNYELTITVANVSGTARLQLKGGAADISSAAVDFNSGSDLTNGTHTIAFTSRSTFGANKYLKFDVPGSPSANATFEITDIILREVSGATNLLDVIGNINAGSLSANSVVTNGINLNSSGVYTSIDTDLSSVSGSDDTLASAKAIKTYVDGIDTTFGLAGDSGTGTVDMSQTLTLTGGAGISSTVANQTATLALSSIAARRLLGNVDPSNPAVPAAVEIDIDLSSVSGNHDTIPSAKAVKDALSGIVLKKFNHVQNTNLAGDLTLTKGSEYDDVLFVNTADPGSHNLLVDHAQNYADNARIVVMNASENSLTIAKVGSPSAGFDFNCPQLFSSTQTSITLVSNQKATLIKTGNGSNNVWDVIVSEL